jgi:hypothetical protein
MKYYKLGYPVLAVMIGFAAVLFWIGLIDVSSTLAQGQYGISAFQPPPDDYVFTFYTTEPLKIPIQDLSGNEIGEGVHTGKVRCTMGICSQKTELILFDTQYVYQFQAGQFFDSVDRRVIVSGKGTISNLDHKERFQFVAVFQDNRDGTLSIRYEASTPAASFMIPRIPGRMRFGR